MMKIFFVLVSFFLFPLLVSATYETFIPQHYAQKNGFFEIPYGYNITDYWVTYVPSFEVRLNYPQVFLNKLNEKFWKNKVETLFNKGSIRGIWFPEKQDETDINSRDTIFLNMKFSLPKIPTNRVIRYYPVDYRSGLWYRAGWENTLDFPRLNIFNESAFLPSSLSISATQSGSSLISDIWYSLKYKILYLPEVFLLQENNISSPPSWTMVVVPYYEFQFPKWWTWWHVMLALSGYGTRGFYSEEIIKDGKGVLPIEYK